MHEKMSTAAIVSGASTTLLGMTQDQWGLVAIVVGIATTLGTFVLNAWMQWDRRKWDRRQMERRRSEQ